jgi:signal transduction histidine kinase
VRLLVEDTGEGIPADRVSELFAPFHQLDGSTTRRQGGTGLGLALVKRIVEAHGASVQVASTLGQGTRFWFDLPVESDS